MDQVQGDPSYNFKNCFLEEDEADESPYNIEHECSYISPDELSNLVQTKNFSNISINVRSLGSKWDEICSLVYTLNKNAKVSTIAFQEVWNIPSPTTYLMDTI